MNLHTTYNNADVINNEKNMSISVTALTVNTLNNDDIPNTQSVLNILLPIKIPIAMFILFFFIAAIDVLISGSDVPTAIIAKTTKGKGVSFMEGQAGWHGKAPNDDEYAVAMEDLKKVGDELCQK